MGVITMCGVLVNFWLNVMVAKQPAGGELPVLIVMLPEVSDPLSDTVPPPPVALPRLMLGVGPPAKMWWVRARSPFSVRPPVVIDAAVSGPLKLLAPVTLMPFF